MLLGNAVASNDIREIQNLAESGVACAMGYLGMAYRDGLRPAEKDIPKAKLWLERGSKSDDACSMYGLGEMRYDENTKSGAQEARLLWKRAAQHGHLRACYKYGVFLYAGLGGSTNNVEARRLLEKASVGGLKAAWLHYSRLLSFGLGGPADEEMAQYWADKVATEAPEFLDYLNPDVEEALQMKALTTSKKT